MLEYKKIEKLFLAEFGILLLLHILYGLSSGALGITVHMFIFALLFWVPSIILYCFLKNETIVKYFTCLSFGLCTYLITVDVGSIVYPMIVFVCVALTVAMFTDKWLLAVYKIESLIIIIFLPLIHPEIKPPQFPLQMYYMYMLIYVFVIETLFVMIGYGYKHKMELDTRVKEAVLANRSKTTFLANISHEIRTPMNAITGMSELLLQGDLSATEREYVNTIRNASDNLLQIINDLLDFSKIDAEKLELTEVPYNIGSMVYDMQNLIAARLVGKEVPFLIRIDPTIPGLMHGDDGRIRQMLLNVLTNAVKFTKRGKIELEINWEKTGDQECKVIFKVTDTGIGIRKEELPELFNAFSQADIKRNRNVEGTGLGLVITKKLAEQMQGSIEMESEYGVGTVVTITILQKILKEEPLIEVENKKQKNIYLYEPNSQYQRNFFAIAKDLGMNVTILRSLFKLPEQIEDNEDTVVFYDYVKGEEKIKELAKHTKHIRYVAIAGIQDQIGMTEEDTNIFLRRPVSAMSIANALWNEKAVMVSEKEEEVHLLAPTASALVVDDNFVNLRVVGEMLALYQIDVTLVSSGYECIRMMEMKKEFDVIFMDHMMPHLDGIETTKIIRNKERMEGGHQVIIALTANAMQGASKMFLEEGMDDFLAKPVDLAQLEEILCKWIPKEKQLKESVVKMEDKKTSCQGRQLDYEQGLAGIGNREEAYLNILRVAAAEGKKKIPVLRQYYEAEEWKAYTVEVHALKSSMAGIGAMKLSGMAKEHEYAAKTQNIDYIRLHFEELLKNYQELVEEIEDVLKQKEDTKEQKEETIMPVGEIFMHIKEALEEYEADKANEWIEKAMQSSVHNHRLEKLLKYTEQMEYEKALEILEEMLVYDDNFI